MKLEISHATPEDARAVAQIHVAAWREAYKSILPPEFLAALSADQREALWTKVIQEKTSELLIAKRGGLAQGWLNFGASRDAGVPTTEAEVMALYVSPASWSSGIGRQLWLRAKDMLVQQGYMTCSLWVFPENTRAIRFYGAAGFAPSPTPPKVFELGGTECREVRYACPIDR